MPFLLAASLAQAEDAAACYEARWAGVPAAELRMAVHDGAGGYRNEIEIRTLGLVRWVTRFQGTATATGRLVAGHLPVPATYRSHYDLRKRKHKVLSMRFLAEDGAIIAERQPDDTSRKPQLAVKFRRNVLDTLGILAAIRQHLGEHPDARFTLPAYDGARRFDVVSLDPPHRAGGVIHVRMTLRAIAGFKGESSDDGDPDNAPRPVEVTFSDDRRLMPLSMTVPIWYLPLTVTLTHWLHAGERCPE